MPHFFRALRKAMFRISMRFLATDILCQPMIQDFPNAASFHTSYSGYLDNLYEKTTLTDPFSKILKFNSMRLMVSANIPAMLS